MTTPFLRSAACDTVLARPSSVHKRHRGPAAAGRAGREVDIGPSPDTGPAPDQSTEADVDLRAARARPPRPDRRGAADHSAPLPAVGGPVGTGGPPGGRVDPGRRGAAALTAGVLAAAGGLASWSGGADPGGAGPAAARGGRVAGGPGRCRGPPSAPARRRGDRPGAATRGRHAARRRAGDRRAAGRRRTAAGADLALLNLARKLTDGELVAVGVPGPVPPGPRRRRGPGRGSPAAPPGRSTSTPRHWPSSTRCRESGRCWRSASSTGGPSTAGSPPSTSSRRPGIGDAGCPSSGTWSGCDRWPNAAPRPAADLRLVVGGLAAWLAVLARRVAGGRGSAAGSLRSAGGSPRRPAAGPVGDAAVLLGCAGAAVLATAVRLAAAESRRWRGSPSSGRADSVGLVVARTRAPARRLRPPPCRGRRAGSR